MPISEKKQNLLIVGCALTQLLIVNLAVHMLVADNSPFMAHALYSLACVITVFAVFYIFNLAACNIIKLLSLSLLATFFMQYLGLLSTALYSTPFDWLNALKTMFYAIAWVLASNVYLLPLTLLIMVVFFLFFVLYKKTEKQDDNSMVNAHKAAI